MLLKSFSFVAVIKAMVAGEIHSKYTVDLSVSRYQSLDSKRVVSTVGTGGSLELTMGKDEGMWRRWKRRMTERGWEKAEKERQSLYVCAPLSAGGRTSKTQRSKGCFALPLFSFFHRSFSYWIPHPPFSNYSSVSPQRQRGRLDSAGHHWHESFCCITDTCCQSRVLFML